MALDTTKWATSSDGDLEGQPALASSSHDAANDQVRITFAAGPGILRADPAANLSDIFWISTDGNRIPLGTSNSSIEDGSDQRGTRQDLGGLGKILWQRLYKDQQHATVYNAATAGDLYIGYVPQSPNTTNALHLYTPYLWEHKDLSEVIFAWTRFHSGGGTTARDWLDKDDLIAFSTKINSAWKYESYFDVWAIYGQEMGEMIAGLCEQAGALHGFGSWDTSSSRHEMKFFVRHWDDLDSNTDTYDFDDPASMFLIGVPQVRQASEDAARNIKTDWGAFFVQSGLRVGPQTAQPFAASYKDVVGSDPRVPYLGTTSLRGNAREYLADPTKQLDLYRNSNSFRFVDEQTDGPQFSKRSVSLKKPNVMYPEYAGATVWPEYWRPWGREVQFTMGPKHFDFKVGEIINISSTKMGFNGTETMLVRSKDIDIQTGAATIVVRELVGELRITPDSDSVYNDLALWLDATDFSDSGTYPTGTTVSIWYDKSQWGHHAGNYGGTPALPAVVQSAQNSLPAVDFGYSSTNRAMDLDIGNTGLASHPLDGVEYTVISVCSVNNATPPTSGYIIDSDSPHSGYDFMVGIDSSKWSHESSAVTSTMQNGATVSNGWTIRVWRLQDDGGRYSQHFNEDFVRDDADPTLEFKRTVISGDSSLGCDHQTTGNFFLGQIGELLVFERALTPYEIRGILNHLRNKWAIT
jgi:hypothetical protein